MILNKLQFITLIACIALQTFLVLTMFTPSQTSGKSKTGVDDRSGWRESNSSTSQNQTTATSGDATHGQLAKTQKPQYSLMKRYEEDGKPANILDFIDNNLKKVVIGVITVVALMIIVLVCCCVCCAATVCNPARKKCDTEPKQKMDVAEKQEYLQHFYSVSNLNKIPSVHSPVGPWKSSYFETPS